VFGKSGEAAAQYLTKGQTVFVEGRLSTRSWEQDDQKKYRTEIVADNVQFGPKSGKQTNGGSGDAA
jgi:single-strand DNA-binding protein